MHTTNYYKIVDGNLIDEYDFKYQLGLNTNDDGLYFYDKENVFKEILSYSDHDSNARVKIIELYVPRCEKIEKLSNGKYRSNAVNVKSINDLFTIDTFRLIKEKDINLSVCNYASILKTIASGNYLNILKFIEKNYGLDLSHYSILLNTACNTGYSTEVAKYIINKYPDLVSTTNIENICAIDYAELLKYIINHTNIKLYYKRIFNIICMNNYVTTAKYLLIHCNCGKYIDEEILGYMIKYDSLALIKIIMNAKLCNHQLCQYMLYKSCECGKYDIVKYLIRYNVDLIDINAVNDRALYISLLKDNITIAKYLLDKGANIHNILLGDLEYILDNSSTDTIEFITELLEKENK